MRRVDTVEAVTQNIDVVKNSLPGKLTLDGVDETDLGIIVRAWSQELPQCPACFGSAISYHSRYIRRMRDLPWQGRQVELQIQTRRFRCRNNLCDRKIFAERLPSVATPRARETKRLCEMVGLVGYALGGLPGSRLLVRLGMPRSTDTVLRRVKQRALGATQSSVRVLSVDDWAWRKHQRYGTMLMDLENKQVIDLLPVRSAHSFATWLTMHPTVKIITRDRSGLYADGGRQGAAGAVQITDRYHLVSNLGEAVEREIQQLQISSQAAATHALSCPSKQAMEPTLVEARRERCRQARYERYVTVMGLRRQGQTQVQIAEKVGMAPDTVARWLNAPEFPERQIRSDRHRDQTLFLQKQDRGLQPSLTRQHYSSARMAAFLRKPPGALSAMQSRQFDAFLPFCPTAHKLRRLVLQFRAMLRWRNAKKLCGWIKAATDTKFGFLAQFAKTLRRDWEAVVLSITTPWSNGPIEGQINRLKVIKRQMYGRAGFELLKARVLPLRPLPV